jgi:hypothetical protein
MPEAVVNPIEIPTVSDLFEKDPDLLTPEDRARIIAFYRDARTKFQAMEAEGGPKKAKAAAKKKANAAPITVESSLDMLASNVTN